MNNSYDDAEGRIGLNEESELPGPENAGNLTPTNEFEVEEPKQGKTTSKTSIIFSRGVQLYCLAMLCGSLMKATSKLLVQDLNPFILVFARMFFTSTIAIIVMRFKHVQHYFWGHADIRLLLFIRGLLGFMNICLTYFALMYMTLPDLAVISFLTPLTTCIGARIFLGEQYHWKQALASCVSLIGVVVMARPPWLFGAAAITPPAGTTDMDPDEASHFAKMRSIAICGSLFVVVTASAVMIILRKIADRAHALASVSNYAVTSVVGSTIAIVFLPASERNLPSSARMWGIVCLMGVFGFMLQYLSSKAIQLEEASVLSNFKYTQLVYATILEFIFWHDVPDWISLLGIVLILVGVLWTTRVKANLRAK